MIKCEVIKDFTLKRFNELVDIKRSNPNKNESGKLYSNDTFKCEKDIADYLAGGNAKKEVVVKVIEVEPEVIVDEEVKVEKPKTKKKTKKKKTSKK